MSTDAAQAVDTGSGGPVGSGFVYNPWKFKEHRRLYVNRSDGSKVGYLDLEAMTPVAEAPGTPEELTRALAGLAPGHKPPRPTPAPPAPAPPAPLARPSGFRMPWTDLAENRPGQSLEGSDEPSYLAGLAGEQRTAGVLAGLERRGYRILHAVPISPRKDIDHLVIGPTGVWAVNTKSVSYAVGATVSGAVFSDGYRQNWVESISRDAAVASEYLSLAARMEVPARPVVAVWSAQGVKSDTPRLWAGEHLAEAIQSAPPERPAAWVDIVYSAARRSDTWTAHH